MTLKVILHVGTEKTGSTSIQRTLHNNIERLAQQGYLVPQTLGHPCHIHLTGCALESEPAHPIRNLLNINDPAAFDKFRRKTLKAFKKEISKGNYHTILISDEHINMHLIKPGLMESYKDSFDEIGEVSKVLIYLRRQDAFRLSLFSEAVKAGNMTGFDADNPLIPFKVIPNRFNYIRILSRLAESFGQDVLTPRLFRRDELVGGDAILDYLDQIGVDPDSLDLLNVASNPSLDAKVIWAMAKMGQTLKAGGPENEQIRRNMLARIQKTFTGKAPKMRAQHHSEFLARFGAMNKEIKETYFPERQFPLFKPIEKDVEDGTVSYYPECSYSIQELTHELEKREGR